MHSGSSCRLSGVCHVAVQNPDSTMRGQPEERALADKLSREILKPGEEADYAKIGGGEEEKERQELHCRRRKHHAETALEPDYT